MATKKPPVKKSTPRKRKRNKDGQTFEEWANTEQPPPTARPPNDTERSVQSVLAERLASDLAAEPLIETLDERRRKGREKYGQELFTNNGRDPLVDALQEVQDLLVYLQQAEMEGRDTGVVFADVVALGMLIERDLRAEFNKTAT